MSDNHSEAASIDEDDFFSVRGSNELPRNQYEDHSIWDDESTKDGPTYTAFQSLPSGVEHEAWRGEADDEDALDLVGVGQEIESAVARIEALEGLILLNAEGAPTPAYPIVISDETDVLRAEEKPLDTETVIPRVVCDSSWREPINLPANTRDAQPRGATNGSVQPTETGRQPANSFDEAAFNHRPELDEADPAPRSPTPYNANVSRHHRKSKKGRNGKPSSKHNHDHREGHNGGNGTSSRPVNESSINRPDETSERHGSGRNERNRLRRRDQTPPPPTSSRSRNRSRDHTGSTVRSDSGSGSARFNVTYVHTPRIDSNQSDLYKGFCWGWKPTWWPETWWWPDTVR